VSDADGRRRFEDRVSDAGSRRRFEDIVAELEEATARLAAGELGIEDAVELYERAERLHAEAAERLEQVRARVEKLPLGGGEPGS
jgi:exodeoxyribonuclease VII small subunit